MPSTNNSIENVLTRQATASASFARAKLSFREATRKNAVIIGREIMRLRKDAGLSRRQVGRTLGVSGAMINVIERPAQHRGVVNPDNQVRYLSAVKHLTERLQNAARSVCFERSSRGRRQAITA